MSEKSFPQIVTHILQKVFFQHALRKKGKAVLFFEIISVILKKCLIVIKYNQSTLITNSSIYEKNHHVIVITFVFNI